jgi:outer membrane protein assembly factor BamB
VWRESGLLEKFPAEGLRVRWRTPIGAGYAGPAVAAGRVYVTDRQVRTGAAAPADPFERGKIPGTERVLCLRETDGTVVWQHEYDCPYDVSYPAGPRATPTVHRGRVYTLGTEGNLLCLDAASGRVIWSRGFKKEYGAKTPLWGFSSHPLIEDGKRITLVGGEGQTVMAFDLDTGQPIWRALSAKEPGYAPPVMVDAGGRRQLIVWHPESINALNPATGELYWSQPFAVQSALTVATPRVAGDLLLVSSFYNGSMLLRLDAAQPAATLVWKGKSRSERNTDGLHSIISTPFVEDNCFYGVCSYGQLRGLNLLTGERLWETLAATGGKETRWGNAFIVKQGDRFYLANEQGDLILARLTPKGYEELSRAHLLDPTNTAAGHDVVWSHPAFANRCVYARNDREIDCVSLAGPDR